MIKLNEIANLPIQEIKKYYRQYINIGTPKILNMLGFDKLEPEYAEGMFIYTKDKRKIYDFTGGISVLNLGHNHPRILAARSKFNESKHMEVWKLFLSPYLAVLSKNLAEICPGDLNYSFFCNSGAEANEGALKIASKYQGSKKDKIIYTDVSYHGKTHATLSVSGIEKSKKYFKLLEGCVQIPYGDCNALEEVINEHINQHTKKNDIAALIIEAVNAGTVTIPQSGYLQKVRKLCTENDILLIIDDIFCGFGRTGAMFSFQHENIVPDIFTVSKSLGGGKASIAAYVVRDHIYKKAYGDMKNYMIHSSTFNGLGEECYTAIEAINVIIEENLVENSKNMGKYLRRGLNQLKKKYPDIILDVKGIGLLNSLVLSRPGEKIINTLGRGISFFKDLGDGVFSGIVVSQLLHKYSILITPSVHRKNMLLINPPLIITKEDVDYFIESLDDYFSKGFIGMGTSFGKMKFTNAINNII